MIHIAKPYITQDEKKAVMDVLSSGMIAQGPKVAELEEGLAAYCGTKKAVAFNSGTAALHTAMHVAGIREGDEVVTTPFTFIATANTILMNRAKPVFADINPDTFNIDPKSIEEKITGKTKAIVTVDIYGQACDYEKIRKIAKKHDLIIIEDACQAIGAKHHGRMAGSLGDIGCFSFYATKNITCAEGGALATDNERFAADSKLFRQHGMTEPGAYDYNDIGYNYRTTDINAAILIGQLKRVEAINNKRIENAAFFDREFRDIEGITTPYCEKGNRHVYHEYTLKVDGFKLGRDELLSYLKKKGVGAAIYYPKPLHLCNTFRSMGYKEGDFPVAEDVNKKVLSLPVHPLLTYAELKEIAESIKGI